jgi:uncharacterized coiled-coil protein SlyX
MTSEHDNDRAEIETKLAFHEHEIDKLHKALYEQQKRMDAMALQLKRLTEQYTDLAASKNENSAQEKPPHY